MEKKINLDILKEYDSKFLKILKYFNSMPINSSINIVDELGKNVKTIFSNQKMKISKGIYTEDFYIISKLSQLENDAAYNHILRGYTAYDETGSQIVGTIDTWEPASNFYTNIMADGEPESIINANRYNETNYYIKKGTQPTIDITFENNGIYTPEISTVNNTKDNNGSSKDAISGDIFESLGEITTTKPSDCYYLNLKTNEITCKVNSSATGDCNGWLDSFDSVNTLTENTLTVNSSNVYLPIESADISYSRRKHSGSWDKY